MYVTILWLVKLSIDWGHLNYPWHIEIEAKWHFADNILRCIWLNENFVILTQISLKFIPKGPIDNKPALVQIMAWHCSGSKPLSEQILTWSLMHICVTRPGWVYHALWAHVGIPAHFLKAADGHCVQPQNIGLPLFEGILPKVPYLPCVSMVGRALLAGYHRVAVQGDCEAVHVYPHLSVYHSSGIECTLWDWKGLLTVDFYTVLVWWTVSWLWEMDSNSPVSQQFFP